MTMNRIFVLGAAGFVGREVVKDAVARGDQVLALCRHEAQAEALRTLGATPVVGDVRESERWATQLSGATHVFDLIQPPLPARLGDAAISRASAERVAAMRSLVGAIASLPAGQRPVLISVSGLADLARDSRGLLSAASQPQSDPRGFARIGLPVRAVVERSGLARAFVHLGTVYGPGKAFAARLLPNLARGKAPIIGDGGNRMALIHVTDAARALVHLTTLEPAELIAKTWIVADGAGSTQRDLFEHGARLMGGPPPRRVPRWLASLVAGSATASTLAADSPVDNSALLATGFRFRYPSHQTGLPATVQTFLEQRREANTPASEAVRR
ncbi:MAG TPA: NAD-dependent epimerase/dehydratase family protein [Polyangiaceae bacterium]|nr:NAD-dependent epimerase/dehydratase family protein [Polyangiaceae bacterium]